jgi:hypothetical protein
LLHEIFLSNNTKNKIEETKNELAQMVKDMQVQVLVEVNLGVYFLTGNYGATAPIVAPNILKNKREYKLGNLQRS